MDSSNTATGRRHTDKTHAEVLEMLDMLLVIGVPARPAVAPNVTEDLPPAVYPVA